MNTDTLFLSPSLLRLSEINFSMLCSSFSITSNSQNHVCPFTLNTRSVHATNHQIVRYSLNMQYLVPGDTWAISEKWENSARCVLDLLV